jgi:hypothetical protein
MKRWIIIVAVLIAAFVVTIKLTAYIAGLPDSNCVTGPVSQLWSGDRLYKATILRKNCLRGEAFSYSVRIDKPITPTGGWFFTQQIEKDDDQIVPPPPVLKWTAHQLGIEIPNKAISGAITRREGDLTVTRSYVRPKTQPEAP